MVRGRSIVPCPSGDRAVRVLRPWSATCPLGYVGRVATTFTVLAEPTRRRILDLLLVQPRSVGELVAELGLTQPGTSKHLKVLREAGLVRVRRDAQRRWYELRPEPLAEVDTWLAPYRRLWAAGPERHLDTAG
ncbi:DNA-binding transcriptional regulator, ArsR family [Actinokineospora diospyrosa]|uniref:DNA-binding transcriptional regulator, ArsR family n=1 Tax=Actinokineospora diospyrosa TaxID=103728 RepID=A0ABT1IAT3_9PSEU|nr:DNA-binding transcriptional regulator, ArsR family [Actinokineospora diospyrosa]